MNLVILVEELSTKYLLEIILPKVLPEDVNMKIISHDGKSDLKKSVPRKLKNWKVPDTKFLIVQDQDSNDCKDLKQKIINVCGNANCDYLVRIACREMEAWYFGDLEAVSKAYGKDYTKLSQKRGYRIPDKIGNPKQELRKHIPEHEQISGAKRIAPYMNPHNNSSESFNALISGVKKLVEQ